MKKTQVVSVGIAFVLAITFNLHAQDKAIAVQSIRAASANDLSIVWQAVEATTPVPVESVPLSGTFYSAQNPNWPPLPCNINNLDAWNIGNGMYMLDDLDFDYQAQAQSHLLMIINLAKTLTVSVSRCGWAISISTIPMPLAAILC